MCRSASTAAAFGAMLLVASTAPVAAEDDLPDADRGAELWAECQSCHDLGPDARNRVGPHLNDLFGRRAAVVDDYDYSDDMLRAGADGLVWSTETLDVYIGNPRALVTGTRMAYGGLEEPRDRADLIAFLRAFSASPRDIPEAAPTAPARDPDVDPEILAIQGDPAYGEYLAGECVTCHQASGADEGIPSITGWPERDFVTVLHAYKNRHRPHPVMRMIASNLSEEEIAALAAYFRGVR